MPIKNGRLILERQISDFAERFTVDPNNLLEVGTVVSLAQSGNYEIRVSNGTGDNRVIGVIYALDKTGNPYVALMGRCIVNVRGSVGKGDALVLNASYGKLSSNNGASFQDVKAVALTTNSKEHGQVECLLNI
jgi:hypothetical protein